MTTDRIPYDEIVSRLSEYAEDIARDCIPTGVKRGVYWTGDLNGKVSVHISGSRQGMVGFWNGQAGNAKGGGTLINLIELAFGCENHGEAVNLAKSKYLGISKRELTPEEKKKWAQQQNRSRKLSDQRKQDEQRDLEAKVETVKTIWSAAVPIIGTPAEIYLGSRGLELSDLPGTEWAPSLRFHPSVPMSPEKKGSPRYAALIGGVQAKDRRLVAIWRIFLNADGTPLLDREGKKMKLGFGPASGGAVRLGPVTEELNVAEGLETSGGVQRLVNNSNSVWALLSTSGMAGFEIPDGVKKLVIWADGDRHREDKRTGGVTKPPGIKAALTLKERAEAAGIEAAINPSPEPDDWLDVWNTRKKLYGRKG